MNIFLNFFSFLKKVLRPKKKEQEEIKKNPKKLWNKYYYKNAQNNLTMIPGNYKQLVVYKNIPTYKKENDDEEIAAALKELDEYGLMLKNEMQHWGKEERGVYTEEIYRKNDFICPFYGYIFPRGPDRDVLEKEKSDRISEDCIRQLGKYNYSKYLLDIGDTGYTMLVDNVCPGRYINHGENSSIVNCRLVVNNKAFGEFGVIKPELINLHLDN